MNNGQRKHNGLCIGGLVASFFVPLVGLILSIVGVVTAKKRNEKGTCGVVGIVLSSIFIIIRIVAVIFVVALMPRISANIALGAACANVDSRGNYNTYYDSYYDYDYYSRDGEATCTSFICSIELNDHTYTKDCRYDD